MMAKKPKKNQYPAYALKSDDGENEEHWNQDKIIGQLPYKVTPLRKQNQRHPEETGRAWLVKKLNFHSYLIRQAAVEVFFMLNMLHIVNFRQWFCKKQLT